jgi:hypothetical protein
MGNLQHRDGVSGSVGKPTRAAVYSIGLTNPILEGDSVIRFPQAFPGSNFDGVDHKLGIP